MGDSEAGPLLGRRVMRPLPSAQEQLDFIQELRRLLDEGSFVASARGWVDLGWAPRLIGCRGQVR